MTFRVALPLFLAMTSWCSAADALPDPLTFVDGRKVERAEDWPERRAEIRALFEAHVYGKAPEPPAFRDLQVVTRFDKEAFGGAGRLREVVITFPPAGTPPVRLLVGYPKSARPLPSFVGLNFGGNHSTTEDPDVELSPAWIPARMEGVVDHRATEEARGTLAYRWPFEFAIRRGYAMATLYHGDLDPDREDWTDGVHPAFYGPGQTQPGDGEWGAIGAWAWGLRLAASYLAGCPEFDPARMSVMGHSRNGKTALWAGALDERFALVVSNQSGCGGAALSRPRRGEKLVDINTRFPHWFTGRFHHYNDREHELPVDQHELLALIAPRPVLVCSATGDLWADPEGEHASCVAAAPVYRLLGTDGFAGKAETMPGENQLVNSRIGYHIRPGEHGVGEADWKVFFDFADAQLGKP